MLGRIIRNAVMAREVLTHLHVCALSYLDMLSLHKYIFLFSLFFACTLDYLEKKKNLSGGEVFKNFLLFISVAMLTDVFSPHFCFV